MPKPRKKYLQRPSGVEYQHYLIRDIPKSLVRKVRKKAKESRPPTTFKWVVIALLERWAEGVNPSSDYRPPSIQQIDRGIEQSF